MRSSDRLAAFAVLAVSVIPAVRAAAAAPAVPASRLPEAVVFEPNLGQAPDPVKFLARGRGYALDLTPAGVRLALAPPAVVVELRAAGAAPCPRIEGRDPLASRSHYFTGGDPRRWRTGVPHYAAVAYRDVYPGVDLVFHARTGQLEYDFVLAPGAAPSRLGLVVTGGGAPRVDAGGDLVVPAPPGELRQRRPVAYQRVGGRRRPVEARYVVDGAGTVRFALGPYDRRRELVIDPVLAFSTYLGGVRHDGGEAVAVDLRGNVYVAGAAVDADSTRFAMVSKLDPTGSKLLYRTLLGTPFMPDEGFGLAVDRAGSAYVTGCTSSYDPGSGRPGFPTTPGAFQTTYGGGAQDAFLAKLDPSGALVYSTYLGGGGEEAGLEVAADGYGNASVVGWTDSADFPVRLALQPALAGGRDAFVLELDASGSALLYSTFLGGADDDEGRAIALDLQGRPVLAGLTRSSGAGGAPFPTVRAPQPVHGGGLDDAFVAVLAASGRSLVFSTYLGGSGDDVAEDVAVRMLQPYVTGTTTSADFPLVRPLHDAPGAKGEPDGFLARLSVDGGPPPFSTYLGHNGGAGVALDPAGRVYLTGGGVLAARLRAALNGYDYTFGGPPGRAIAADARGNAYVAGTIFGELLPTTPGAYQPRFGGRDSARAQEDAFVVKLSPAPQRPPSRQEHDAAASVTGDWVAGRSAAYGSGRALFSQTAGSRVAIRFTGTGVRVVTRRCPECGLARVRLDGTPMGQVDTYGAPAENLAVLTSINGLAPGGHTLELEVSGTGSPRARGAWVTFDGFDVVR